MLSLVGHGTADFAETHRGQAVYQLIYGLRQTATITADLNSNAVGIVVHLFQLFLQRGRNFLLGQLLAGHDDLSFFVEVDRHRRRSGFRSTFGDLGQFNRVIHRARDLRNRHEENDQQENNVDHRRHIERERVMRSTSGEFHFVFSRPGLPGFPASLGHHLVFLRPNGIITCSIRFPASATIESMRLRK